VTSFSIRRLALLFLRVGNLTFGGGDPTMAALHRELVVSRGWLHIELFERRLAHNKAEVERRLASLDARGIAPPR